MASPRSLHDRLSAAAAKLRGYGDDDDALSVEAVAAPKGWVLLQREEQAGASASSSSVPLTLDRALKAALVKAAKDTDTVFSACAEEGVKAFLAGEFTPPRTPARSGAGYSKTTLTITLPDALREEVRRVSPGRSEEAGYRITESSVALSWLLSELGVRRPGEDTQPFMLQQIPQAWYAHWQAAAAEQGVSLDSVLADGIRALRDGVWVMPRPVRPAKGSGVQQSGQGHKKLTVQIETGLLEFLDVQAPALAREYGVKVFPGTVGMAILKDRLGLPDGA